MICFSEIFTPDKTVSAMFSPVPEVVTGLQFFANRHAAAMPVLFSTERAAGYGQEIIGVSVSLMLISGYIEFSGHAGEGDRRGLYVFFP